VANRSRESPIGRFHMVEDVVDHLFSSRHHLEASMRSGGPRRRLWPSLRLRQYRVVGGDYEARLLCVSDSTIDRAYRYVRAAAVKQIIWDRQGDRTRTRRGAVAFPKVMIRYYRVPRSGLQALDAVGEELDVAVSLALDKQRWGQECPTSVKGGSHLRQVIHDDSFGLQLRWTEAWVPAKVNQGWTRAWDALGVMCTAERELHACKDVYDFPARSFARLRASGR
jgi:hypothetical protein